MGTGWNDSDYNAQSLTNYNRLGYGYWLEQFKSDLFAR